MTRLQSILLGAVLLGGGVAAWYFGSSYVTTFQGGIDEKAEWSVLQAAYQTNKDKTTEGCSPLSYAYRDSKAIGFQSPQGRVWILTTPSADGAVKAMPEGVKFYAPKSGLDAAVAGVSDPKVLAFIRQNAIPGCP
ncbi:hypothetical protein [Mitsuaria sp. GD03876]|uniref:hypothetical protein n=1 Tax=Mitsuaria sp. GD03876 TaxID=2975399 RepID=UPI002446CA7F|nr:hypothetical protein [Mitsuaria sp. GD03876]MDH0864387.1 hypothetical protein [Mitsuaria sp. GD03876]